MVMAGDKLLDLPTELLEKLLGNLPIKSLVGMNMLSKNWADRWIDIPQLTIDDPNRKDFISLLKLGYHALYCHRGNITGFSLDCGPHSWEDIRYDVDCWIHFLAKNGVERISLTFLTPCDIVASSIAYRCVGLKFLRLRNCSLSMAEHVTGFESLSHLDIGLCEGLGLDSIINGSPNLKKVVLYKIDFDILEISSESLTNFSFEGSFREFSMRYCPNLVGASIKLSGSQEQLADIRVQPLPWLCNLQRLTANGLFLKFLGPHISSDELDLVKMECLHFYDIDMFDSDEMMVVFTLIRSCLNLKKLTLKGSGKPYAGGAHLTRTYENGNLSFRKLKAVRIKISIESVYPKEEGWNKTSSEIIKMVMAGSPNLEEMVIYHDTRSWRDEIWLFRELLTVKRASSQLKLRFN